MRIVFRRNLALVVALVAACSWSCGPGTRAAQASSPRVPAEQHTRYYGTPDLALTAALVQAGGGPARFSSARLVAVLAGNERRAEARRLRHDYGAERLADFFGTLTFAFADTLAIARRRGISLPPAQPGLATDGGKLSAALLRAGTMADGRFDVGYMLEHLISRPVHVQLMHDIDRDPRHGPARNADCHAILTAALGDLKTEYGL